VLLFYHLPKFLLPPNNYKKNQNLLIMKKFIRPFTNFTLLFFFLVLISPASFAQVAPVSPPTGGFNIDGTVKVNSAVGDWVQGTTGTGGYVLQSTGAPPVWGAINTTTTKFVRDPYDNAADLIFTGSSFGDNPNDWKWTTGKATAKCDIGTALIHSTTSATQKWLILGGDRFAQTGTSYIDFQFSQGIFTRTATGFSSLSATGTSLLSTNGRTVGDFVLSMEYTAGGAVATVHYYRWEASGSTYKFVEYPIPSPGGVASAFGASNTGVVDVPYGAFGSTTYAPFAFAEAAVNIGAILTGSCQTVNVKTIFVSTKASDSYSAALKDFVEPQPVNFVFGNAGLSYNTPFCKSDANPAPTVPSSPSGNFAGSTGLNINPSTGVIDLAATDAGTYTATYTPTGGVCLTPATAVITILANPAITPGTNPAVCRGVTSASLTYSGATGSPTKYSINFNATAEGAGFVDVTDANLPSSPINIVVPATAAAATYNGVLTVKSAAGCVSSNYNITVTVNALPSNLTADVTQPTCSTPTGTITVTSGTTNLTFSINSTTPADFTNSNGIFGGLSAGTYTIRSKNTSGCISAGLEKTVTAGATAPPAGTVTIISNPSCSSSTGTLKVVKSSDNTEYSSDFEISETGSGVWFEHDHVFTFIAGAGYNFTVRRKSDHTCTTTVTCAGEVARSAANSNTETATRINNSSVIENTGAQTTIKAYPNPFSDRVKFMVTSSVAGNGNLEIYNMMGQKIKTVYQGYIAAGTQTFELSLPGKQVANLVYVLTVGDKKVTGKILQMNQ
jgi:hypothetical protein